MNPVENLIFVVDEITSNPSRHGLNNIQVDALKAGIHNLKSDNRRKEIGEKVDIVKAFVSVVKTLQEIFQDFP
jgi:hypothetical protein